ncbi:hypothetical protein P5F75_12115 [Caldifermentibacillus hisashii]|jgi:hypothetical protein|uniref:hypothetical protein n=1 Tax=Caldifermentibacillus hisashii TaxID=996558 RepID=UPI002E202EC5|nr:hypothetical protein [Caldifermentibacillus hisashii]
MKKRFFEIFTIILITFILILDFMPNILLDYINGWIYWLILIALGVFVTVSDSSTSSNGIKQIIFSAYLISLLILLTVIFGKSIHGFSTYQSGFWIVLTLFIIQIFTYYYKKRKNRL